MKKEYIVNWQGNDFVKYEGLLDEAHQQGLCRISTTLVQIPHGDNGNVAVVTAEVETAKGVFSGIGDAAPGNVNRMIVPHILRMAETRAKARALRDAVNFGVTALEELGEDSDYEPPSVVESRPQQSRPAARQEEPVYERPSPPSLPTGHTDSGKTATPNQLATIAKLSKLLGESGEVDDSISGADASDLITQLSQRYNERKKSPAGLR